MNRKIQEQFKEHGVCCGKWLGEFSTLDGVRKGRDVVRDSMGLDALHCDCGSNCENGQR